MIKYVNGRFYDYPISPKIRQTLLHGAMIHKNYCKKQKINIKIGVVKKRLLNIILKIKKLVIQKIQEVIIETFQKKKKKRKENI